MDFRNIARQLNEMPIETGADGQRRVVGHDAPRSQNRLREGGAGDYRHIEGNQGNWGTRAEADAMGVISQLHQDGELESSGTGNFIKAGGHLIKTDFYEEGPGKRSSDNVGYSVKATKRPDVPVKIQESGNQMGATGAMRKLLLPGSTEKGMFDVFPGKGKITDRGNINSLRENLKDNKLSQAFALKFGLNVDDGNGNFAKLSEFLPDLMEMSAGQREKLKLVSQRSGRPFFTNSEMRGIFGEHYELLLKHLQDNKVPIFNQMMRGHNKMRRNIRNSPDEYNYGDPKLLDKLVHIRSKEGSGSNAFPAELDLINVSDDAVKDSMDYTKWYDDGKRFYLAPEETDDINQRLIDLYPYDEEADTWELLAGFGDRETENRKGARPGLLKATMGIDPDMLSEVFGDNIRRWDVKGPKNFNGRYDIEEILNNVNEEVMNQSLRTQKEIINMRERALSDWRSDLQEEHPYVDVMPSPTEEKKDAKKKLAKKAMEVKEGYKKQSERKHDDMNDAAHKHDKKLRKKLNPELSDDELSDGKFSSKGDTITQEIESNRQDPTEYKKERKAKEIENRAKGYRKRMNKEDVDLADAYQQIYEKELSIEDQMKVSREAAKKRNPNPDHKAIRGKMLAKAAQKKDNRTDAEKMADATGPRKGSNFRGD